MRTKEKTTKKKTWVLQAQLISILRRLFVKSPLFQAVRRAAQVEYKVYNKDGSESKQRRVKYRCSSCGELFQDQKITYEVTDKKGKKKTKKVHEIAVDHTEPVVPLTGMPMRDNGLPDYNTLIDRMMLGVAVWDPEKCSYEDIKDRASVLCWRCHESKSEVENAERRLHAKEKKGTKR